VPFLSRSTQDSGFSQKDKKEEKGPEVKAAENSCESERIQRVKVADISVLFLFQLGFSLFFAVFPGKLAKALIFTCELKNDFWA